MTLKEYLKSTKANPEKANYLDTLADQAERQREIDEDMSIDTYFGQNEITKAN